MKLLSFVKQIFIDAAKTLTSKAGIRSLFRVSLYRNTVYLLLNSAVLAATGFFFWMVAARVYPEDAVGLVAAAISAMSLLAVISTLGLDYALIRFLPGSGEKAGEIINSCFTIGAVTSITLALIFLAGLSIWSPALLLIRGHPVFLVAFVIFTAATTLNILTQRSFIAGRKAGFTLVQGLIFGFLRFIPLIVLAAFFESFGILASWGIALGLAVTVGVFLLPRVQTGYRPLPMISKRVISDMMRFSLGNYAANLLWSITTLILPLVVVNLLGAEQNAYFYIGWAIGSLLFMISTAVSFSLFAEGSHAEEQLEQAVKKSLKFSVPILILAVLILLLLGDRILLLFGAAYSQSATRLLWIVAASALPLSVNQIYFSIKRVEKRIRSVISLSAFIAITTLALSYILLPQIGIIGAGISWLIAQSLAAAVTGYKLWRRLSLSGG